MKLTPVQLAGLELEKAVLEHQLAHIEFATRLNREQFARLPDDLAQPLLRYGADLLKRTKKRRVCLQKLAAAR